MEQSEQIKYNQLQDDDRFSSISLIHLNNLETSQENGILEINIPAQNCGNLQFYVTEVIYNSPDDYYWRGVLSDDNVACDDGVLTMYKNEDFFISYITLNDRSFEIIKLNDSQAILAEYDREGLADGEVNACATGDHLSPFLSDPPAESVNRSADCRIYILVVHDPENTNMTDAVIENHAQMHILQANEVLKRSGLHQYKFVLAGVGTVDAIDYENGERPSSTSGVIATLLRDMVEGVNSANTSLGEDIANWREEYLSDVTVLFHLPEKSKTPWGVAETQEISLERANAVVKLVPESFNRYTFVHELAHLIGCNHNRENSSTEDSDFAYGFKIKNGQFWSKNKRTAMHKTNKAKNRIANFSNPSVDYIGDPTGDSENDNARQSDSWFCEVASFRPEEPLYEPDPVFAISSFDVAPHRYCTSETLSGSVETVGGTIIAINWSTSTDGIHFTEIGNNASVNFYGPSAWHVYVKVEVWTSIPHYVSKTIELVKKQQSDSDYDCPFNKLDIVQDENLKLYPNPVETTLTVPINLQETTKLNYQIIDASGRIKSKGKNLYSKKARSFKLDVGFLNTGTYYLELFNAGNNLKQSTHAFYKK